MCEEADTRMTKAITFLGNVKKTADRPLGYARLRYTYGAQACETEFVAEAIHEFFQPRELYIVTTQEGYENHFEDIRARLANRIVPQYKKIPTPN